MDLVASGSNDLGGWRFAVPIDRFPLRTNAWKLGPAIHLAGQATALDRKTPHVGLVVELVQPEGGANLLADSSSSPSAPAVRSPPSRLMLQLDGSTYAELPNGVFKSLTQATIEGRVKWDRLDPRAGFVSFGTYGTMIMISNGGGLFGGRSGRPMGGNDAGWYVANCRSRSNWQFK